MRSVRSCWSPISPASRAPPMRSAPQSAVSLKLKRLEAHLGKPLLAYAARRQAGRRWREFPAGRPRAARCARSCAGRDLGRTHRLSLGVSEHVAVPDLPAVLTSLHRQDPGLSLEMHLGTSTNLLAQYDERRFDAVIVRHEPGEPAARRRHAAVFRTARLARRAGLGAARGRATAARGAGRPVRRAGRRAARARPCGAAVARALYGRRRGGGHGRRRRETAVCPLARVAPRTLVDVGTKFGLPPLPLSQVVLYSRVRDARAGAALRVCRQPCNLGVNNGFRRPQSPEEFR